ncbi:MAG: RNA polymerase sigma factor [Bacteroidia bacterium]|nr:RNA polymerase sigma factor [Bacteroidia bacterium]
MINTAVKAYGMEVHSKYHVSNEQMAEELAIIEAAKLDAGRFEPLYNRYHEQIFRYAYQRLDDKDLCFDIVQQVFLKAITNLRKYEYRGLPFVSWLYRIAQSEVYQTLRDRQAQRCVSLNEEVLEDIADESVGEKVLNEARYGQIAEVIADLNEEDLQLVEMRFCEKRSFKEAAEILGITENAAKVRMYRALERIRKMLNDKSERSKS